MQNLSIVEPQKKLGVSFENGENLCSQAASIHCLDRVVVALGHDIQRATFPREPSLGEERPPVPEGLKKLQPGYERAIDFKAPTLQLQNRYGVGDDVLAKVSVHSKATAGDPNEPSLASSAYRLIWTELFQFGHRAGAPVNLQIGPKAATLGTYLREHSTNPATGAKHK